MRIRVISEFKDREALGEVAEKLEEVYGEKSEIEVVEELIDKRFLNPLRNQYDAWRIVQHYRRFLNAGEYMLLVTDKDIYAGDLNFVFGLAWRGVAIISTCRLFPEFYGQPPDRRLFIERAVKEAVHEIGHLHGLTHCDDEKCVMKFSNSILDTDDKSCELCEKCSSKLRFSRF